MTDIPAYNEDFALYRADVFAWCILTKAKKENQGLMLYKTLPKDLRKKFVAERDMKDLCSEKGADLLIKTLETIFADSPSPEASNQGLVVAPKDETDSGGLEILPVEETEISSWMANHHRNDGLDWNTEWIEPLRIQSEKREIEALPKQQSRATVIKQLGKSNTSQTSGIQVINPLFLLLLFLLCLSQKIRIALSWKRK